MFNHLKDILEEIEERNKSEEILPYEEEFLQQLRRLESWEKIFIMKRLYSCEWQVGSPHLMSLLQYEGFFNISVYLTNPSNANDADNILNDLLEVEHSLLAEIILCTGIESSDSEKLIYLMEKCCENAMKDLLSDPELKIPNYLERLSGHLRLKEELQRFRDLHLTVLASLNQTGILEALKNQKIWASEDVFRGNSSLKELIREATIISRNSLDVLLSQMTKTHFSGWKLSLAIFNFILKSASQEDQLYVKKYVEGIFWRACISRSEQQFWIFLLLIREISYSRGEEKRSAYLTWYKATISEMSYKVKPEDFRVIMGFLSNVTRLEEDPDFLDVHIKSSISAPPRCNDLVIELKQISRIRLNELNPIERNETDVILLD